MRSNARSWFLLPSLCLGLLFALPSRGLPVNFSSHPSGRPLPVPSDRPKAKGPSFYVDAVRGNDADKGTEVKPWKSVSHGVKQLKAGDTLYLRGGVYYEHVTVTASGTAKARITIRSHPGELAILDGGIREFFENPSESWEPCPDGAPGEYRSTKTYPGLSRRQTADSSHVFGSFGDSMIPLQAYRFHSDLQSTNEFWTVGGVKGGKVTDLKGQGIYCGPGIWYDITTERVHCRLAHTTIEGLGETDNYRGETDPRKLPLVIAGINAGSTLAIQKARNLRIQDLVCRGSGSSTIDVEDSEDIEFDGVTTYGGNHAFGARDTTRLRVLNSAFRGLGAPWTFRGSLKYRAVEGRLFAASGWNVWGNKDFELAYSEFTDSVDGVFIGNVAGVQFHHNVLDNVTDDGIFLTATTAYDGKTHGGNIHIRQNYIARCLTAFAFGVGHGRQKTIEDATAAGAWGKRQTGAGVWISRNVFDFRRQVNYQIPQNAEEAKQLNTSGRMAGDHGSPTWEPMCIYQNTILAGTAAWRNGYAITLGMQVQPGSSRRIFNNIFCHIEGAPGTVFPEKPVDLQADGNLSWSATEGAALKPDFLAKLHSSKSFAASKTAYPPGCGAHDLFDDPKFTKFSPDWRDALDLRVQEGSPAIDAGMTIPREWSDPVRAADKGKPDIGAIPLGVEPWRVGVRGRFTMFGEQRDPAISSKP